MTLEDSIHSQRLRVLRDAERLGNVSEACRLSSMAGRNPGPFTGTITTS